MKTIISVFFLFPLSFATFAAAHDYCVGVAPNLPRPVALQLAGAYQELLAETADAGDTVTLWECPGYGVVSEVVVPEGSRNGRLRNTNVRKAILELAPLLVRKTDDGQSQINLPGLSAAIQASRREAGDPIRVILVGDPTYHVDHELGWSMKQGEVITTESLKRSDFDCPFNRVPEFPAGTTLSLVTPAADWGKDGRHRLAIEDFYRVFAERNGATLLRTTSNVKKGMSDFSLAYTEAAQAIVGAGPGVQLVSRGSFRPSPIPGDEKLPVPVYLPPKVVLSAVDAQPPQ